jgi:hypothetical protein
MLSYDRLTGPMRICEACQTPLTAGWVLWALKGQRTATAMAVHDGCMSSPLVTMFLGREYHRMPVAAYLEKLYEAVSV